MKEGTTSCRKVSKEMLESTCLIFDHMRPTELEVFITLGATIRCNREQIIKGTEPFIALRIMTMEQHWFTIT